MKKTGVGGRAQRCCLCNRQEENENNPTVWTKSLK